MLDSGYHPGGLEPDILAQCFENKTYSGCTGMLDFLGTCWHQEQDAVWQEKAFTKSKDIKLSGSRDMYVPDSIHYILQSDIKK